jgi:hypothetical protein
VVFAYKALLVDSSCCETHHHSVYSKFMSVCGSCLEFDVRCLGSFDPQFEIDDVLNVIPKCKILDDYKLLTPLVLDLASR